MTGSDLGHDGQPETGASAPPLAGLVESHEAPEHPLPVSGRNPGTVVVDMTQPLARLASGRFDDAGDPEAV